MERLTVILFLFAMFTTECQSDCQQTYCVRFCMDGYDLGQEGCASCQCLPETRSSDAPRCESMTCYAPCPFGYEQHDQCPTCTCAPENAVRASVANNINSGQANNCSEVYCFRGCPSGFETDSQGCPTCTCVEDSSNQLKSKGKNSNKFVGSIMKAICQYVNMPGCP